MARATAKALLSTNCGDLSTDFLNESLEEIESVFMEISGRACAGISVGMKMLQEQVQLDSSASNLLSLKHSISYWLEDHFGSQTAWYNILTTASRKSPVRSSTRPDHVTSPLEVGARQLEQVCPNSQPLRLMSRNKSFDKDFLAQQALSLRTAFNNSLIGRSKQRIEGIEDEALKERMMTEFEQSRKWEKAALCIIANSTFDPKHQWSLSIQPSSTKHLLWTEGLLACLFYEKDPNLDIFDDVKKLDVPHGYSPKCDALHQSKYFKVDLFIQLYPGVLFKRIVGDIHENFTKTSTTADQHYADMVSQVVRTRNEVRANEMDSRNRARTEADSDFPAPKWRSATTMTTDGITCCKGIIHTQWTKSEQMSCSKQQQLLNVTRARFELEAVRVRLHVELGYPVSRAVAREAMSTQRFSLLRICY